MNHGANDDQHDGKGAKVALDALRFWRATPNILRAPQALEFSHGQDP